MDASDDEDDDGDGQNNNNVDGKKWDVYSLSIVFAYMFTGKEVYPGLTNPRIFRGVPKGKRPDTTGVDEGMVKLMHKMWTRKHTDRPTMEQVLEEVKKVKAKECVDDNDSSSNSSDDEAAAKPAGAKRRVGDAKEEGSSDHDESA